MPTIDENLPPFATLADLQARLDWELDDLEQGVATSALEDLSDSARYYGADWPTVATAPRMVRTLVLRAAKRHLINIHGYTQSRAGDETVAWSDRVSELMLDPKFTQAEIKDIETMAGKRNNGLVSVGTFAYNSKKSPNRVGYVGPDRFPYYASEDGPW